MGRREEREGRSSSPYGDKGGEGRDNPYGKRGGRVSQYGKKGRREKGGMLAPMGKQEGSEGRVTLMGRTGRRANPYGKNLEEGITSIGRREGEGREG